MTTIAKTAGHSVSPLPQTGQVAGSLRFDWAFALLAALLTGGVYLDGWAHGHGRVDQSFFTPWHAILYTAFLLVAAFLAFTLRSNYLKGYAWRRAVPAGYEAGVLGAAIFALGGWGDLAWHMAFGIEKGVEALITPSHFVLALGGFLIASGPLRAAWQRRAGGRPGWRALAPAILSLTYILSGFTFFTAYAHPVANERANQIVTSIVVYTPGASHVDASLLQAAGVASILLQSALLMGVVLLAIRRWRLPLGAFTLMFTLNGLLMSMEAPGRSVLQMASIYGPMYALLGLAADLLNLWLKPSAERVGALRIFAFGVPTLFAALYFVAILVRYGEIGWSVHVWTGTVCLAGFAGLLLSFLLVPLSMPRAEGT